MATTNFKGVSNIGEASLSEVLGDNVVAYVDWSFLQTGAYYNVPIPTSGSFGGNSHQLYPVLDPRYDDDSSDATTKIWRTYRGNWVWESGMSVGTPISISGIFINNEFQTLNNGYTLDYPNGRVILDNELPVGSSLHMAYSHKLVKVVDADAVPFFRKVQPLSMLPDDPGLPHGSGIHTELAESRLELPLVGVRTLANRTYDGYEIGNLGGTYARTEVVFHVLAENDRAAKRIADILADQHESTLFLYSPDQMRDADAFPLNAQGGLTSNPLTYPDLIRHSGNAGYRYTEKTNQGKMRIAETRAQPGNWIHHNLYHIVVRWDTEVIKYLV